jgi:uncharacterized protein YdhG (YjbR/CyaY superfamily)
MNKAKTIDEYLSSTTPVFRKELEQIRSLIKKLVPTAEETISYNMPTFKYKDRPLVFFTASKNHMSFYPSPWSIEDFKDKLKDYKTTSHAIQFTLKNPLPKDLIKELVMRHVKYIEANRSQ